MNDYGHDANPALSPHDKPKPWYRYPWVWFFLGLLLLSISASLTLVTLAVRHADDLVSDNWYKDGRGINQDMAAEQMADSLNIRLELREQDGRLVARLTSQVSLPPPESLTLALRHPTMAERDQVFRLAHLNGADYQAEGSLPRGRHIATLTPASGNWRVRREIWLEPPALSLEAR